MRLAQLGFEKVYRYLGGKADWKAAGWPTEGEDCSPRVQPLLEEASSDRYVVDSRGVLLGRRDGNGLKPGVTTIRPDADPEETGSWMEEKGLSEVPVTGPDGVLLGVLFRNRVSGAGEPPSSWVGGS